MAFPMKPPVSVSPMLGTPNAAPLAKKPTPPPFAKKAAPSGPPEKGETPAMEAREHSAPFLKKAARQAGRKAKPFKSGRFGGRR